MANGFDGGLAKQTSKVLKDSDKRFYGPDDRRERRDSKKRRSGAVQGLSKEGYFRLFGYTTDAQKQEVAGTYAKDYIEEKNKANEKHGDIKEFTENDLRTIGGKLEKIGKDVFGYGETLMRQPESLHMSVRSDIEAWKKELKDMMPDIVDMKGYRSQDRGRRFSDWFKANKKERERVIGLFKVVNLGVLAFEKSLEENK